MKYYLLRSDNTWTDSGLYAGKPEDRVDGTWIEGLPTEDMVMYVPQTLAEQLSTIFDTQPVSIRAQFAAIRAAVDLELKLGQYDVVQQILQNTTVPDSLQDLKQQLINKLSEAAQ